MTRGWRRGDRAVKRARCSGFGVRDLGFRVEALKKRAAGREKNIVSGKGFHQRVEERCSGGKEGEVWMAARASASSSAVSGLPGGTGYEGGYRYCVGPAYRRTPYCPTHYPDPYCPTRYPDPVGREGGRGVDGRARQCVQQRRVGPARSYRGHWVSRRVRVLRRRVRCGWRFRVKG